MRIALETRDPLPYYKCWFFFNDNESSTVGDLKKAVNRQLSLAKKSGHLTLSAGGFEYLSNFKLRNYIMENDFVTVTNRKEMKITKQQQESVENTEKKKRDHEKKRVKETTDKQQEKKNKKTKKRKIEEITSPLSEDEQEQAKVAPTTTTTTTTDKPLTRTQKRNKRRKELLKRLKQEEQQQKKLNQDSNVAVLEAKLAAQSSSQQKQKQAKRQKLEAKEQEDLVDLMDGLEDHDEQPTELSSRKNTHDVVVPSTRLLKQNKNKKGNFLKQMEKQEHQHFRFDIEGDEKKEDEENDSGSSSDSQSSNDSESSSDNESSSDSSDDEDEKKDTQKQKKSKNKGEYGSAIVTWMEADDRYDGPTRGNVEYPIHSVGDYFHADAPPSPSPPEPIQNITSNGKGQQPTKNGTEKPDYESLPAVTFTGPYPQVNDLLGIKLLEMSASYTPEISDWKQVKVIEFDQSVLTVEFQPGFLLKEQQGKFTIRENHSGYEDEEEVEEEEQYLEDQTKQLTQMDVVDMRKI